MIKNYKEYEIVDAFRTGGICIDGKGRYFYFVTSSTRRNGQMIVPAGIVKRLIKEGDIDESLTKNLRKYD